MNVSYDFTDKVALVTGAGSGIGRASAQAFSNAGASVVVADIDDDGGKATVGLIEKARGTALFVHVRAASGRWSPRLSRRSTGWISRTTTRASRAT